MIKIGSESRNLYAYPSIVYSWFLSSRLRKGPECCSQSKIHNAWTSMVKPKLKPWDIARRYIHVMLCARQPLFLISTPESRRGQRKVRDIGHGFIKVDFLHCHHRRVQDYKNEVAHAIHKFFRLLLNILSFGLFLQCKFNQDPLKVWISPRPQNCLLHFEHFVPWPLHQEFSSECKFQI